MQSKKYKKNLKSVFSGIGKRIKGSPLYGRTLIVLLFIALIVKGIIIYISYNNLNPRENVVSYLASDIPVIFCVHLLVMINYWIKKPKLRLINDIIAFVILLLYIADMFTIFIFHSRVALTDIFVLGSNGSSGFSGIINLWLSIFVVTSLIIFFLVQSKMKFLKKSGKNMLIVFSMLSFAYALFYAIILISKTDINYVEDVISLNIQKIKGTDAELDQEVIAVDDDGYHVSQVMGEGKDLNIILVFAESLSAIDSFNVGGNNNIPNFDRIQRNGITFTNFITNGVTSDTAHIATLYGVMPLINVGSDGSPYSGYKLMMQPLPKYLNTQGYSTTFISTASLKFLNQRNFLSGAGFQKIVGEEEFENNKKYTFDSAPDGDLYSRVLDEIQVQTGKYFIGLQTISYHKPYNTPYGKSEKLALKYADDKLYEFYQELLKIGFFDDGILVIVGDHRKMLPAESGEIEKFGSNRYAKSVATVVGSGIQPGEVNGNIIQHTDFYNSLKRLVGNGYVDVDSIYNDIFTQQINRKRGITSARYYTLKDKYTVSVLGESGFTFSNISSLINNGEIYDYLVSYLNYEVGNQGNNAHKYEMIIGHQGARSAAVENSLQSFLEAKNQGADGIEFDVSYTKDKVNIVAHGEYFYASDCVKYKIKNYTYDWIKDKCTLKNGEKYRTLKDMMELIDGLFNYYFLEIKVYNEKLGAEQALDAIQTVKDLNMQDRVIFISYSDAAREVLASDPDIIFGRDTFDVNDLDFVGENNSKYFLAPYNMLTPEIVKRAKGLGKEVATYTVNETGDFQAMKDLGIKFIMTDEIRKMQEYNNTVHYPIPHSLEELDLKKSSGLITEDYID